MSAKPPETITCPFTIVCDSREQSPYLFHGLSDGPPARRRPIIVPTMRAGLDVGDYSIFSLPQIIIERKSKADLFGSVVRRDNFESRLARMGERAYSAVVVEACWDEILRDPPRHSKLNPKSLFRTVLAWDQRYPVKWWFLPGREAAEAATFRLLERFFKDHSESLITQT